MQLTDDQKREVASWIEAGAKLSEVQQRLGEAFGVRLTYMEARFLVDDLKLVPQEKEEPKKPEEAAAPEESALLGEDPAAPAGGAGKVSVTLDQIMRPGALVSGKVTFSDGVVADWYLDQTGRMGFVPPKPDYRPSAEDLTEFKIALERELSRQGL